MKPPQSSSTKLKNKTGDSSIRSSNPIPEWISDRFKDAANIYNALNEAAYNTGFSRPFFSPPEITGYELKKPQVMPGVVTKPDYSKYGVPAPTGRTIQLAPIRIPIP